MEGESEGARKRERKKFTDFKRRQNWHIKKKESSHYMLIKVYNSMGYND